MTAPASAGSAAGELTPERTAFVRFRAALVRRGLDLGLASLGPDRALFEAVTRQLDSRDVVVRTGTLVDATLLPSASIQHDGEARWMLASQPQADAWLQGPRRDRPGRRADPRR